MDIATVGSSVLSAFLQVLFDRMASREFFNLFRERKHDDRLLKKLKTKLLVLKAVLDDAENKQIRNPDVKEWLGEVHDAVYRVDDLLDEINTEALRVKVETAYQSSSNSQVCSSPKTPQLTDEFLDEIMPKIEEMLETLDNFGAQIQALGLKEGESNRQHSQHSRLPSTSLVDESTVYGRDADKEEIIRLLSSDGAHGNELTVISIVGLGGIGKTTLAQLVYSNERVKSQFDTQAWVCISEAYNAVRITKTLREELSISYSDSSDNFNSLQMKLQQGLKEKKFFLVLDDVWNKSYTDWETLTRTFNGGKQGSKVIVTTRDESIALMIRNGPIHHLHLMAEEDCWSLFEKHAFGNREIIANSELRVIGKDIVKKCEGLPLAVKTLGGLLRSKSTVEEWVDILRSDVWDESENPSCILPSLRLSYNHLPPDLKRCFSYCAVFPKDYEFRKDQVIVLWIANDLLRCPRNDKRLEDIGNEFFCELRSRSLFEQSSSKEFSMHDLVNDLAKSTTRFVGHDTMPRLPDTLGLRHFSYFSNNWDECEKFKPLLEARCLRTFLSIDWRHASDNSPNLISKKFLQDILPTFTSLRVLSLSPYNIIDLP